MSIWFISPVITYKCDLGEVYKGFAKRFPVKESLKIMKIVRFQRLQKLASVVIFLLLVIRGITAVKFF